MKVNREEIARRLYGRAINMTMREANEAVEETFKIIAKELGHGNDVHIPGFGVFHIVDYKLRHTTNMHTGEDLGKTKVKCVRFRAFKGLNTLVKSK